MRTKHMIMIAGIAASVCTSARADITGFLDGDEWESAVESFTTIDFTDYPQGTVLNDQYADLGIQFTDENDWILHSSGFLNDGAGLVGSNVDLKVTIEFSVPQLWFGIDHSGSASLDVFTGGELIDTFHHFGGGFGKFTGIVSTVPFETIVIYRHLSDTPPFVDDMHWGVPSPGAVAVLGLAALLTGTGRRRS